MFREIAPIALEEGLTVLYIQNAKDYAKLLKLAEILFSRGWRVMLIMEDIDQAFEGEVRDEMQQDILNTLDGGYNKDMNLISLLTTNFEDKLNPFFIRRLTDIIHFHGMDANGAKEFVQTYIPKEYLDTEKGLDYSKVYDALVGVVPSLAKRIFDKALVIRRAKNKKKVGPEDILISIASFKRQEELSKSTGALSKEQMIAISFQRLFSNLGLNPENMQELMDTTYNTRGKKLKA
jgi:hypothetical protein